MKSLFSLVVGLLLLAGCATPDQYQADLHQSEHYYNYIQPDFDHYLAATEDWLLENRAFISQDKAREMQMNMPFQMGSPDSDKAILLVHGLGDSPFSFRDVAQSLVTQGFYVQTLLLPGHGSNPAHMAHATYSDWQLLVHHYATMLRGNHQQVWLGGFSTGGNLVTIHAMEEGNIDGLMLFSPGFQTVTPVLEKLTPFVSLFTDGWTAPERNFAKYNSAPIVAALAYSESAKVLRDKLKHNTLTMPTLMVVSEADSVIDAKALANYFENHFINPNSQMIWYGSEQAVQGMENVAVYSMKRDDLHISTASHMSSLFAPENRYYGQHAEKLICENSFSESDRDACERGEPVWFSAWGYTEDNKVHARLTWNPYFKQLQSTMATMVQ
ncbi:2-succinyl-6-hydroxy-2, 4-cyclohexadiene-1-carboxylate synthase [Vibrio hippocampi]|uniref:2-succinyl-6-hydroxy-2, 4-cyclohexadiene-1-carboxylate synthase n=2 Tax=Vibrio hippocampi TaxID=654686 RepID=A0ABN8DPY8_9VIBR|nr:2-succinyl-6-hydroxy-2, 4-cyclohexadiene-1-carboxylate synthase [Vibrio hippocampi]